jgi:hypothetical protein
METLIGFAAGYIAGCKDGPDGVKRLRATATEILNSTEVRKLAGEALNFAEALLRRSASGHGPGGLAGTVGSVTELVRHRAGAIGKGPEAA